MPKEPGLRFPCVFGKPPLRVFWDLNVTLDLTKYSALEVDLTCPHPESIQSLLVYAKSGHGWYAWRIALQQAGQRKHILPLHQASTEGQPAGWAQISAFRISAFPGNGSSTHLTLQSIKALSCELVVLQASPQTAGTEALAARNAANRISRWLTNMGIPHLLVTEHEAANSLKNAAIAILPYSPAPDAALLNNLESLLRKGGKLMVFYSSSEKLANLMDIELGDYKRSDTPGHWASFTFLNHAPAGTPTKVFQNSSNIRPVKPTKKTGRILAYWNNEKGQRMNDPAWVQTDKGLWMTHIALDGDDENKKRMLATLLALYEPSIWPVVAEHYRTAATCVGPFNNMIAAQAGINEIARINAKSRQVKKPLAKANETEKKLNQSMQQANYPSAVELAIETRRNLIEAYALAQTSTPNEFRGLWCHAGQGLYPGNWNKTAQLAANSGFNALFPNLLWAGITHYPSQILPVSDVARLYGDQLEECTKAAQKHGLQVHAWKICWNLGRTTPDFTAKLKNENRLQINNKLQIQPTWLCPAHPDNIAMELAAIAEIITRQPPLHGIHLDYIRFPDANSCFCPTCRRKFEEYIGRPVSQWPADVLNGPLLPAWRTWRKGIITDFVRSTKQMAKRINPNIKISAAVFSAYPQCADSIGQDWGAWLKDGLVDFVCPMTYQADFTKFCSLTRNQLDLPNARGRIYPGLGVTASESQLAPDQVISQIAWLRANGASGFLLFDLTRTLEHEILPFLKLGVTEQP